MALVFILLGLGISIVYVLSKYDEIGDFPRSGFPAFDDVVYNKVYEVYNEGENPGFGCETWNYIVLMLLSMVGGCTGVVMTGCGVLCVLLGWKSCIYEMGGAIQEMFLRIFES